MKWLAIILLSCSFSITAQNDKYVNLINKSDVILQKTKKELLSAGKTDVDNKLAQAFLLQAQAVKDFGNNHFDMVACNSSASRRLAIEILNTVNKEAVSSYYSFSAEDNTLLKNCLKDDELINRASISFPNLNNKKDIYFLNAGYKDIKTNLIKE